MVGLGRIAALEASGSLPTGSLAAALPSSAWELAALAGNVIEVSGAKK